MKASLIDPHPLERESKRGSSKKIAQPQRVIDAVVKATTAHLQAGVPHSPKRRGAVSIAIREAPSDKIARGLRFDERKACTILGGAVQSITGLNENPWTRTTLPKTSEVGREVLGYRKVCDRRGNRFASGTIQVVLSSSRMEG